MKNKYRVIREVFEKGKKYKVDSFIKGLTEEDVKRLKGNNANKQVYIEEVKETKEEQK